MALGIKMFSARTASGQVLRIEQIKAVQPLSCEHCGAKVKYTGPYERGDRIKVSAYLSLSSGARHHNRCEYDAKNQIEILCGRGESIADTERVIFPLAGGGYEFRLTIPSQAFAAARSGIAPSPGNFQERVQRLWSGSELAPYCRKATGLAKIMALLAKDRTLESVVTIRWGDQKIPWRSFFFGEDEGASLLRRLRSKAFQASRHPVAVLVRTKRIELDGAGLPHAIQCGGERVGQAQAKKYLVPRLYGSPGVINSFDLDQDYVVFGEWYVQGALKGPNANGISFENANVRIFQSTQYCKIFD